jgi:formate/nitrite transporter
MPDPNTDPTGPAIAEAAPGILAGKAAAPWPAMAIAAVMAGAFIAFGSIAFLVAHAAAEPSGPGQILAGLAFSVGLILVTMTGAELFTGDTMFVLPLVRGRVGAGRVAAAWIVVWLGNLVGSVLIAALFVAAGGGSGVDGLVGSGAVEVAASKVAKDPDQLIASGMLANMLVCLAVWMAMTAHSLSAKIAAIVGPVTVFVAAGFEHSIANQSLLTIGWLLGEDGAITVAGIAHNLLFSTIGNIVGGAAVALPLGAIQRLAARG